MLLWGLNRFCIISQAFHGGRFKSASVTWYNLPLKCHSNPRSYFQLWSTSLSFTLGSRSVILKCRWCCDFIFYLKIIRYSFRLFFRVELFQVQRRRKTTVSKTPESFRLDYLENISMYWLMQIFLYCLGENVRKYQPFVQCNMTYITGIWCRRKRKMKPFVCRGQWKTANSNTRHLCGFFKIGEAWNFGIIKLNLN